MLVAVLIKLLFAACIWRWALPSFTRDRSVAYLLLKIFLLTGAGLTIDLLSSWQFAMFTLHHMIVHPSPVVWLNGIIYLGIAGVLVAIFFMRQWLAGERRQRELAEMKLATELAYLRSQIHPHFLFNTLNNIFSVAQRDKKDELAMSISRLAGLLRYILYEGSNQWVPLNKEIDHLRDFIGLASMRYGSGEVQVNLSVSGDVDKVSIAPMILLPFVENAFKHGIRIEDKSVITVTIEARQNEILFTCENEKVEATADSDSSGIGLANVKRRIELLYADKHQLSIDESGQRYSVNLVLKT